MNTTRPLPSATGTWVRFSNRTGRAEINTGLACVQITEAARSRWPVTVAHGRRLIIDQTRPSETVTYTPANVAAPPLPWQWELLERLAATGHVTGVFDKAGQVRLRLSGQRPIDAAGSAVMIDRGWVSVTTGHAHVTAIGQLMLADYRARTGVCAPHCDRHNPAHNNATTTTQQSVVNRENTLSGR